MDDVLVLGAGISGLAAACRVVRERPELSVRVLEAASDVGGRITTRRHGDWTFDTGPHAVPASDELLSDLATWAGVSWMEAREASAHRFIVHRGRPREVTPSPMGLLREGLFGPLEVARGLTEPWRRARPDRVDESVDAFARRRFGPAVAQRLFAPMVQGVFAGDSTRLSMAAAFPSVAEWERTQGSVLRGLAASRRAAGSGPKGLRSCAGGLQELPRALATSIAAPIECGVKVRAIAAAEQGWRAVLDDGTSRHARSVIVATPAPDAARLLRDVNATVADELAAMVLPPLTVVALGFEGEDAQRIPEGYGVLAPREESVGWLGALFETRLFPDRSPQGSVLVRVMVGGRLDEAGASLDDEAVRERACAGLARLYGVGRPCWSDVARWPESIPQYEAGHLARTERVGLEMSQHRGLVLAGNFLHGVSVGKAAACGWREAGSILEGREHDAPSKSST